MPDGAKIPRLHCCLFLVYRLLMVANISWIHFFRCTQRTLVGSVYNSKSYSTMRVASAHRDAFLSVRTPGLSTSDSGGP